jgi:AcrR family transcriptional regulator
MPAADHPAAPDFTAKGRATRERIIQAAARVLLAEGLSGFNVDLVRQAASVSGSQVSHYFANRQTLVRAVLRRQIEVVLNFHRQPKLGGLDTFEDWERWADLNLRYLRKIGHTGTPTYHSLAGQLAKSDDATRQTLGEGYWRWVYLLEESLQRMRERGVPVSAATPRQLAMIVVAGHQGSGSLTFAYRQEWPLADVTRFLVNYLRLFAADPAERSSRTPRPPRTRWNSHAEGIDRDAQSHFTRKGVATRTRIVRGAAELMFDRGVNGTSLQDVRSALTISGSQLSHYFADKRDLTRHVIASRTGDVVEFHTQPRLAHLDSLSALRAWGRECVAEIDTVYLRGGCVYGSLAGELLEADEAILDDLAAGYERWLQLFRDGLTAMRYRGELGGDADPRHLAAVLVIAHQGGAMLTHATGDPQPFEAVVGAALDYVASFRPPPKKRAARSAPRPSSKHR